MFDIDKERLEMLEHCRKNNPAEYNFNKAVEEIFEFGEVITKLRTKNEKNPKRPDRYESIKEFADLVIRGTVALGNIFPEAELSDILIEVEKCVNNKLDKIRGYKDEGKYLGGL